VAEHITAGANGMAAAAAVSIGEDDHDGIDLSVDAVTAPCKPRFTRGKTLNGNFFPLKIRFPAGCQWFAKNNERGSVAWWLTENSADCKTRRSDRGVGATGTQTVGIFYRGGWDEVHVLDVCLGTSCSATDAKVAQYRFKYSRP
jgi:hypothetical protein